VGRKPSSRYEDASIGFMEGSKFRLFDVDLPFGVKVTFQQSCGENIDGTKIYGTSEEILLDDISNKKTIIDHYEKNGCIDVKVEKWATRFSDICPVCKKSGIPRIEHKNNIDNRLRNWKFKEERKEPLPEKKKEYWLVYYHKKTHKKCRVFKFIKHPRPAFKNNAKHNITIQKYMYPYCLEWMEKPFKKKNGELIQNKNSILYKSKS